MQLVPFRQRSLPQQPATERWHPGRHSSEGPSQRAFRCPREAACKTRRAEWPCSTRRLILRLGALTELSRRAGLKNLLVACCPTVSRLARFAALCPPIACHSHHCSLPSCLGYPRPILLGLPAPTPLWRPPWHYSAHRSMMRERLDSLAIQGWHSSTLLSLPARCKPLVCRGSAYRAGVHP